MNLKYGLTTTTLHMALLRLYYAWLATDRTMHVRNSFIQILAVYSCKKEMGSIYT